MPTLTMKTGEGPMFFGLDTTDGTYAAIEAALPSPFDLGACPANTDIHIIGALITQAELDANATLSALASNTASAVCRAKFTKMSQFATFGWHMLGVAEWSTRGRAGENICFVGQTDRGAADGSTAYDCINQQTYRTSVATSWATGTVYVLMGFQIGTWGTGSAPDARDPDFQDSEGVPTVWRMDYAPDPGMLHMGVIYQAAGIQSGWSRPDAGSFPRVWSCDYGNGFHADNARWLLPIDPTKSTTDIYTDHVFSVAASQAEVESTPMSKWLNGTVVWVHMPNDDSPAFKIGNTGMNGWNPALSYNVSTSSTALKDLEFINCQFIGASTISSGAMSNGTDKLCPKAKWLGGRYLYGCSWKPRDYIIDGTEWGMSVDGDILWDTSDRPSPRTDTGIQTAITLHGSSQAYWDKLARFIEIDSAREGIYHNGGGLNRGDNGFVNGALFSNIGSAHSVLQTKFGTDFYGDGDSHAIATQGGSYWTCQYFYVRRASACVVFYAIDDAATTQNLQGNVFQDFVIVNNHAGASGAGGNGIDITGQSRFAPRANGSGLCNGNIIRRGYIGNIVTAYGGAPNIDGYAIGINIKDEMLVDNVTMEDCDHCMVGGSTITTNDTYLNHPSLEAPQIKVRNCRFVTPRHYFVHHRFTNWTNASPPNLGYYDFDDNHYIYPSGGNVSTDTPFRFVSTGQTFATWQANTKASPPGEQVSVYDPNSTTEVAA